MIRNICCFEILLLLRRICYAKKGRMQWSMLIARESAKVGSSSLNSTGLNSTGIKILFAALVLNVQCSYIVDTSDMLDQSC